MSGVAWVLGAGFSKPLGGPLLPALLSKRSIERIQAAYHDLPAVTGGWALGTLQELLRTSGWELSDHPVWADAEEFLEHLDAAANGPAADHTRRLLGSLIGHPIDQAQASSLAAVAKRLVAAECCLFLRGADPKSERWRPYVHWATQLQADDVIITFNYDRVVELAAKAAGRELDLVGGGLPVRKGMPRLLKMHGSVDWRRRPDGQDLWIDNPEFAVACADEELCIASPGPSKLSMSEKWKGIWQGAEAALREADAIVFVGYRFPESDATARERLLGSIMLMSGIPHHVAVHTVLGPNTQSQDSARLRGMLLYALGRAKRAPFPGGPLPQSSPPKYYTLLQQPLYAQDFLGLVMRTTVIDPHQDVRP